MPTQTFSVTGLTCDHCVHAVTEELSEIDGVTGVTIDLVPGDASAVAVTSAEPLDQEAVVAALDEAGDYHLTS